MGTKASRQNNLLAQMRKRRQRNGKIFYYYDPGKGQREIPLGDDYVLAVQKWAELHKSKASSIARPTFGWAAAQYLASPKFTELSEGTQADYKFAIAKLLEVFAEAPLDDVTPSHLEDYLEIRGKISKHRAQREISIFGRVFKYARNKGWTKNDPKESVELERLPGRRDVYIYDDMYAAVYMKGGIVLREALDIAYLVGQRPIDVLNLREPKDGQLELRQTKTGTPIRIKVEGDLAAVVERIMERKRSLPVRIIKDAPLLVDEDGRPLTKAKLRYRFETARAAAEIPGKEFQFRDLRAKAATDLDDVAGIRAAQQMLGHASVTMTEHYVRFRRGKLQQAKLTTPKKQAK